MAVMTTRRGALALIAGALGASGTARAQGYPNRLIKLVVGYPPGGPIDTDRKSVV